MSLINDALKRANEQKAKQPTSAELSAELQSIDTGADQPRLWPIGLFAICLVGSLWFGWMWWHGEGAQNAEGLGSDPTEVAAREPSTAPAASASSADKEKDAPADNELVTQELPKIPRKPKQAPALLASAPTPAESHPVAHAVPPAVPVDPPISRPTFVPPPTLENAPSPAPRPPKNTAAPSIAVQPPAPAPATPSNATASFPALSLQGIYYRPTRPAAVINSRTVYVGDRVSNAKILAIDRHEVTVQWNSQVRVLAFQ